MITDEISRCAEPERAPVEAVNDNGGTPMTAIDPRILLIARAPGRQIACEQLAALEAANDNNPWVAP